MFNLPKPPIPKHINSEKQLCKEQEQLINNHVQICVICKASFESYNQNFGIASTPPCNRFLDELKLHIQSCKICNQANKNWNDDAIPVSNQMRSLANKLGRGMIPGKAELESLRDELTKKFNDRDKKIKP